MAIIEDDGECKNNSEDVYLPNYGLGSIRREVCFLTRERVVSNEDNISPYPQLHITAPPSTPNTPQVSPVESQNKFDFHTVSEVQTVAVRNPRRTIADTVRLCQRLISVADRTYGPPMRRLRTQICPHSLCPRRLQNSQRSARSLQVLSTRQQHELLYWKDVTDDICRFCRTNFQTLSVFRKKRQLRNDLHRILLSIRRDREFKGCGLFMVGSSVNGVGTDDADIDLCLMLKPRDCVERIEATYFLNIVFHTLDNHSQYENKRIIPASVPILKFYDKLLGLDVDLNVNNCVGIQNTQLIRCFAHLDWRVRFLGLVAKAWGKAKHVVCPQHQRLSSYSLLLMMIYYLQVGCNPSVLPALDTLIPMSSFKPFYETRDSARMNLALPSYKSCNEESLGMLFYGFLDYYSTFDFATYSISVRLGALFKRQRHEHTKAFIYIEEPFSLRNTASSVYDLDGFREIVKEFRGSAMFLLEGNRLSDLLSDQSRSCC